MINYDKPTNETDLNSENLPKDERLKPFDKRKHVRYSDLSNIPSEKDSIDLSLSSQKELGLNPPDPIRCISPYPFHKKLNSSGNFVFEPVTLEDIRPFCAEEIAKKYEVVEIIESLNVSENEDELSKNSVLNGNENLIEVTITDLTEEKVSILKPENEESKENEAQTMDSLFGVGKNKDIEILPCRVLELSEISLRSDLRFVFGPPLLRNEGGFNKKFIEYQIEIPSTGWAVKRRYNDFLWLRTALVSQNPGSYIPPIPPKKATGIFTKNFIRKRQIMLSNYLSRILRDPILRSSPDTIKFLQETHELSFNSYKKSRTDLRKIQKFSEISTLEGETLCDYSEDSSLCDCFYDYLDVSMALELKLKTASKNLISSYRKLSTGLVEFSGLLEELLTVQQVIPNNLKGAQVYESSQICVARWATHEEINMNNLECDLKFHYSYRVKEKNVLKDLLRDREKKLKAYRNLKGKGDLENGKRLYGHFNYKIKSEFERVIEDQVVYDNFHWKTFAREEVKKEESLESLWEGIQSSFYINRKLFI